MFCEGQSRLFPLNSLKRLLCIEVYSDGNYGDPIPTLFFILLFHNPFEIQLDSFPPNILVIDHKP